MTSATTTDTRFCAVPVSGAGFTHRVVGLLLGMGFTLALFFGIAHYEKGAPRSPPPLDDLRVANLPIEPPPPLPTKPTEAIPDVIPMAGFDLAPSSSPVKIAVSPPDVTEILPEDLSKAPPANAQIGPMLTLFKPKLDLEYDAQHIFQKSEVDQPSRVLDRPDPVVPGRMLNDAAVLRVTLLLVTNIDGSISTVRLTKSSGNPQFDELIIESVKEWVFTPALKKGKRVRCMFEQIVSVTRGNSSRFSY